MNALASQGHRTPTSRFVVYFAVTGSVLFALTGLVKLITASKDIAYLPQPAPIFPELSWRQLLFVAGALEIACALYIFRNRNNARALVAILWLGLILTVFRAALRLVGYTAPCNCIGFVGDWLGLTKGTLDAIGWGLLSLLVLGGACSLLTRSLGRTSSIGKVSTIVGILILTQGRLFGQDFKISGEQDATAVGLKTSLVQHVSFTVAKLGTNWSILNEYTNAGAKQYTAFVDGLPYGCTLNTVDGGTAGIVLEKPEVLLDATPEFTRVLFAAFLATKQNTLTNIPVPFLFPRHPALYSYIWNIEYSEAVPFLPANIRFQLDERLFSTIPETDIKSFFRRDKPKKLLAEFKKTQLNGALYKVDCWTNFEGYQFPCAATLKSDQFDERGNYQRTHTFKVTKIEPVSGYRLLPPLIPNSYVQHIINGTTYQYLTADGSWLPIDQVQKIGTVRISRPPPAFASAAKVPLFARLITFLLLLGPIGYWLFNKRAGRKTVNKQIT